MERVITAGPITVEPIEGDAGARMIVLKPAEFKQVEIPLGPELAQKLGQMLSMSDEELAQFIEAERASAKAAADIHLPPGYQPRPE